MFVCDSLGLRVVRLESRPRRPLGGSTLGWMDCQGNGRETDKDGGQRGSRDRGRLRYKRVIPAGPYGPEPSSGCGQEKISDIDSLGEEEDTHQLPNNGMMYELRFFIFQQQQ